MEAVAVCLSRLGLEAQGLGLRLACEGSGDPYAGQVVELEQVHRCGGQVELAGCGLESAAAELAESDLVFEVGDHGLDGGASAPVCLFAMGGS